MTIKDYIKHELREFFKRGVKNRIKKVPTATENNIAIFDNEGAIKDGNKSLNDLKNTWLEIV